MLQNDTVEHVSFLKVNVTCVDFVLLALILHDLNHDSVLVG